MNVQHKLLVHFFLVCGREEKGRGKGGTGKRWHELEMGQTSNSGLRVQCPAHLECTSAPEHQSFRPRSASRPRRDTSRGNGLWEDHSVGQTLAALACRWFDKSPPDYASRLQPAHHNHDSVINHIKTILRAWLPPPYDRKGCRFAWKNEVSIFTRRQVWLDVLQNNHVRSNPLYFFNRRMLKYLVRQFQFVDISRSRKTVNGLSMQGERSPYSSNAYIGVAAIDRLRVSSCSSMLGIFAWDSRSTCSRTPRQ